MLNYTKMKLTPSPAADSEEGAVVMCGGISVRREGRGGAPQPGGRRSTAAFIEGETVFVSHSVREDIIDVCFPIMSFKQVPSMVPCTPIY